MSYAKPMRGWSCFLSSFTMVLGRPFGKSGVLSPVNSNQRRGWNHRRLQPKSKIRVLQYLPVDRSTPRYSSRGLLVAHSQVQCQLL
jgi:hypothetical protein